MQRLLCETQCGGAEDLCVLQSRQSQLCFLCGAFTGLLHQKRGLALLPWKLQQHGEGEGAVKEQKEPWRRGLSELWTHTVCLLCSKPNG